MAHYQEHINKPLKDIFSGSICSITQSTRSYKLLIHPTTEPEKLRQVLSESESVSVQMPLGSYRELQLLAANGDQRAAALLNLLEQLQQTAQLELLEDEGCDLEMLLLKNSKTNYLLLPLDDTVLCLLTLAARAREGKTMLICGFEKNMYKCLDLNLFAGVIKEIETITASSVQVKIASELTPGQQFYCDHAPDGMSKPETIIWKKSGEAFRGAEACVFRPDGYAADVLAKVFSSLINLQKPQTEFAKLHLMQQKRNQMADLDFISWPLRLLYSSTGNCCGYLMKKLGGFSLDFVHDGSQGYSIADLHRPQIAAIALDMLTKLIIIKNRGIILTDCNFSNILVSGDNKVKFIDIDSAQFLFNPSSARTAYGYHSNSLLLDAQEYSKSVGTLLFMLLCCGEQMFNNGICVLSSADHINSSAAKIFSWLPDYLQYVFFTTFVDDAPVSLIQWYHCLNQYTGELQAISSSKPLTDFNRLCAKTFRQDSYYCRRLQGGKMVPKPPIPPIHFPKPDDPIKEMHQPEKVEPEITPIKEVPDPQPAKSKNRTLFYVGAAAVFILSLIGCYLI